MKEVIITQEQLNGLVNTLSENNKQGSYMAKQQLFTIAIMAYKMWEEMSDDEQLEDWMETKIAQSEQSITSVVKAFMYDELTDESDNNDVTGKLNFDDLIIGK
jgi:hypothetical protein